MYFSLSSSVLASNLNPIVSFDFHAEWNDHKVLGLAKCEWSLLGSQSRPEGIQLISVRAFFEKVSLCFRYTLLSFSIPET